MKATREKQQMTYKGTPISLSADLFRGLYRSEGSGTIYLKWLKGKSYNHKYSTQQDFPSDLMEI